MVNTLVTGSSGFLGQHVVALLQRMGHRVTGYDLRPSQVPLECMVLGDLLAGERLAEAVDGQDMVVHLAANADVRGGTQRPTRDLEQNLLATSLLLEHMRQAQVKHIAFASTAVVYGDARVVPTSEDSPFPVQTSFYGASKVAAEALIGAYCYGFDMCATIFRFAPVLGEGYAHGHVYDFWRKLQNDPKCIEILGNGEQRKSYVYVDDVMSAIECILTRPRSDRLVDIFNISHAYTCSVNQSLSWICEELGVTPQRIYSGGERGWPGDPTYMLLDCSRLRSLGWLPQVTIRDAVLKTVRSFRTPTLVTAHS